MTRGDQKRAQARQQEAQIEAESPLYVETKKATGIDPEAVSKELVGLMKNADLAFRRVYGA